MLKSVPTESECDSCDIRRKDGYMNCTCGNKLWKTDSIEMSLETVDGVPGYNAPGYNLGLGKVIENKKQWEKEVQESNIKPLG